MPYYWCKTCHREYRFGYEDDMIASAREHSETTGHEVFVPFKTYERKGK